MTSDRWEPKGSVGLEDYFLARIGIYNSGLAKGGGDSRKTAAMAEHFSREHEVLVICRNPVDLESLGAYFDVDLGRVKAVVLPRLPRKASKTAQLGHKRSAFDVLESGYQYACLRQLKLDVFLNNTTEDTTPNPSRCGIYMCMFPTLSQSLPPGKSAGLKGRLRRMVTGTVKDRIATYNIVTANSRYTAHWIKEWWECEAAVIYSAGEDMGPPLPKEKIILNVARFTAVTGDNHLKRQDVLIDAFRSMTDLIQDGWQLRLAGSTEQSAAGQEYLNDLKSMAKGLPVHFDCNVGAGELRGLYRKASIYWHATGYGTDPSTNPKQQEHLGLAPIEAMSAGTVPVVIKSGGLRETVAHERTGFHWNDLDELASYTRLLANDQALYERMSNDAVRSVSRFSKQAFLERLDHIVNTILDGKPLDLEDYPDRYSAQRK